MTRKRRRLVILSLFLLGLGSATALSLLAFQDSLVFFFSPSDLARRPPPTDRAVRVGGLVEPGSVARSGTEVRFAITDGTTRLAVAYTGILPDLFREGQGVVANGRIQPDGSFRASEILAKHDENYMPREVAESLRREGHWRDGAAGAAAQPAQGGPRR
ncbi:MAG: cytochrome c maturation protein CcmE [Alphaproteobacteria bacterium]|nr:cytochrome c maturation protein CcmE [Alphaproteobacteria bacterium]